jgi:hypothetical protein
MLIASSKKGSGREWLVMQGAIFTTVFAFALFVELIFIGPFPPLLLDYVLAAISLAAASLGCWLLLIAVSEFLLATIAFSESDFFEDYGGVRNFPTAFLWLTLSAVAFSTLTVLGQLVQADSHCYGETCKQSTHNASKPSWVSVRQT